MLDMIFNTDGTKKVTIDVEELAYLLHIEEAYAMLFATGVRRWEDFPEAEQRLRSLRKSGRQYYVDLAMTYPRPRNDSTKKTSSG